MRPRLLSTVGAVVLSLLISACEQRQPSRFSAGDHVRRKLTGAEGIVVVRLRPFVDDIYFIRFPGSGLSASEEEVREWLGMRKPTSHLDGPYYESDLVLARK